MKLKNQLVSLFVLVSICISCKKNIDDKTTSHNQKIEKYVNHLLKRHEIPGVSLAIIKNDTLFMRQNFGKANLEHEVNVKDNSIFRVYSITKLTVAVAIFQLIEQQKLNLDDEISDYINDLPKTWQNLQIKHLLTHSSGLPAMRSFPNLEKLTENEVKELVYSSDFQFEREEKYDYNQTNFWLLQKIIEKVSNQNFSDFVLENQFDDAKEKVFFSSNSKEIIKNRVTGYFPFETGKIQISHPTLKGDYMFAANGLNITMNEFINWDKKLRHNELISEKSKNLMWQTFNYTKSDKVFTYGWDKRIINKHVSYGFSGSLVTAYRIFPDKNLSIIFLANGLGNYFNIENIINHIANLVDDDIVTTANKAYERLMYPIIEQDIHQFRKEFYQLKLDKNYSKINLENLVNDVGYQLINQKRLEKAISVFQFNTEVNPKSANAFDSLAEVYYRNNQDSLAIINYKKAISLGGTNGNAKAMLLRLEE